VTTSLVLIAIGLAKADGAPGTSREAPKSVSLCAATITSQGSTLGGELTVV
jgi:hypothetical protein